MLLHTPAIKHQSKYAVSRQHCGARGRIFTDNQLGLLYLPTQQLVMTTQHDNCPWSGVAKHKVSELVECGNKLTKDHWAVAAPHLQLSPWRMQSHTRPNMQAYIAAKFAVEKYK